MLPWLRGALAIVGYSEPDYEKLVAKLGRTAAAEAEQGREEAEDAEAGAEAPSTGVLTRLADPGPQVGAAKGDGKAASSSSTDGNLTQAGGPPVAGAAAWARSRSDLRNAATGGKESRGRARHKRVRK